MDWAKFNPFQAADRQQTQSQPPAKPGTNTSGKSDMIPGKKDANKGGDGDDPLLQFESLWEPNKDKDGKVITQSTKQSGPYIPQLDGKKLDEMLTKTNFLGGISQEEGEALVAGGEKAAGAVATMIERATRNAFKTALTASTRLTEQGFTNARDRFAADVPDLTRDLMVDSELSGDPLFKNPALAPMVKMVKSQYLAKFPKASPAEVNNAVKQYFAYIGGEISKPKAGEQVVDDNTKKLRTGQPDADFLEWIGDSTLTQTMFQDNGDAGGQPPQE